MAQFAIQAVVSVPRDAFDSLNVESALTGAEEGVVETGDDEVQVRTYRRVRAEDEDSARSEADDGSLFSGNVPYSLEEIEKVRNLDEPL